MELLANLIYYNKGIKYVDKEYTLDECLWMGMPTWFICDYQDISEKTVHRQAKDFISIGKVKHIEN